MYQEAKCSLLYQGLQTLMAGSRDRWETFFCGLDEVFTELSHNQHITVSARSWDGGTEWLANSPG